MALEAAAEATPPPSAFLGAFEATVLAAPPSPLVRGIIQLSDSEMMKSEEQLTLD